MCDTQASRLPQQVIDILKGTMVWNVLKLTDNSRVYVNFM